MVRKYIDQTIKHKDMEKSVMTFASWQTLQEAKRVLSEAEGVSRAVFGALEEFFKDHGKEADYEQAKAYVASKVKGWDLSTEDFEEAKKTIKESEETPASTEKLDEGKMKEIDIIMKDSSSVDDFKAKLKDHFAKSGNKELADDEEIIDTFAASWTPTEEEK
jgi:uncharacterized membrane-anchored protein YjiN (DUF445 family)